MTRHIIFRFDASPSIGLGHAMRCIAVIQALSKYQVKCSVLTRELPLFVVDILAQCEVTIHELPTLLVINDEYKTIKTFLTLCNAETVFLDGYHFDEHYRYLLKMLPVTVATFDDLNELKKVHADLVINACPDANTLGYHNSGNDALLLLGLKYGVLRADFLNVSPTLFSERKYLLINFGGSDIGGLTEKVLHLVGEYTQCNPNVPVMIVTGSGCANHMKIKYISEKYGYQHIHQCHNMAEIINGARLAICAPGAIIYELAYAQVPSMFFTIADNQKLSAKAHQALGWCKSFDGENLQSVKSGVLEAVQLWHDTSALIDMHSKAEGLVDGLGASRIAEHLLSLS